ncbi:MAG: Mrp/NBP35 family ATP-binding protein [Actinomycetaceae bacterium]|nr:Mrp/NBP35 family ATP-binding protein [Actinomycetaceae bacterium]MDY6082382.1 Mrp/NBP35 family ATP-binding protein [Actinomycetaceae bacterium]
MVSEEEIRTALSSVMDPEIRRSITDLNMVGDIDIAEDGGVTIEIILTISGCPLINQIDSDVKNLVSSMDGVTSVTIRERSMTQDERVALQQKLRPGLQDKREISFAKPGSKTRIYAIASGKGGVGKSSVSANLAAIMAQQGLKVGLVDGDIYGYSIPRMMGVDQPPTGIQNMIIPPVAHNVKVISMGMFLPDNQPIVWRGPMLHRALEQFFSDVYWDELDALLIDLPPGTGDVAISIAELLPTSDILVVTTPQVSSSEVAERAGQLAKQTHQNVIGVVENMSYLVMPDGTHNPIFGQGGGALAAAQLSSDLGYHVPLLGQVPIEPALREASDAGQPFAIQDGDTPAQKALRRIGLQLAAASRPDLQNSEQAPVSAA